MTAGNRLDRIVADKTAGAGDVVWSIDGADPSRPRTLYVGSCMWEEVSSVSDQKEMGVSIGSNKPQGQGVVL